MCSVQTKSTTCLSLCVCLHVKYVYSCWDPAQDSVCSHTRRETPCRDRICSTGRQKSAACPRLVCVVRTQRTDRLSVLRVLGGECIHTHNTSHTQHPWLCVLCLRRQCAGLLNVSLTSPQNTGKSLSKASLPRSRVCNVCLDCVAACVDVDSQKMYVTSMFTDASICIYSACACCVFGVEMPCVQRYVDGVLAACISQPDKNCLPRAMCTTRSVGGSCSTSV